MIEYIEYRISKNYLDENCKLNLAQQVKHFQQCDMTNFYQAQLNASFRNKRRIGQLQHFRRNSNSKLLHSNNNKTNLMKNKREKDRDVIREKQ